MAVTFLRRAMPAPKRKTTIGQALAKMLTSPPAKPGRCQRKQLPGTSGRPDDPRNKR